MMNIYKQDFCLSLCNTQHITWLLRIYIISWKTHTAFHTFSLNFCCNWVFSLLLATIWLCYVINIWLIGPMHFKVILHCNIYETKQFLTKLLWVGCLNINHSLSPPMLIWQQRFRHRSWLLHDGRNLLQSNCI